MKIQSKDFIKIPLNLLITEGLTTKGHLIGINILFPLIVCTTIINIIGQTHCLIVSIQNGKSLAFAANFIFTLLYITSAISKTISVLIKRLQFRNLLDELEDIIPRSMQNQIEYRISDFLKSATRISMIFAIIQLSSISYISFSSIFISCLKSLFGLETFHAELPYGDQYPFYHRGPVTFPALFFIQSFEGWICIGIIYAINFVTYGILIQISMHYEHLAWKIWRFDGMMNRQEDDYKHMIWCVEKHNQFNG